MFSTCDTIKTEMNQAGRTKTPFLFGVDFELSEGFFIRNPLQQNSVLFNFNGIGNYTKNNPKIAGFSFDKNPETIEIYANRFNSVEWGLQRGNSFLTNLTIKTPIRSSLSLHDIFVYAHAMYRLYIPHKFVCFSPERFVKIEKGKIYAHPMKGTIDATIKNATALILNDYKEKAEHYTIVDLIRNDLNKVATKVEVNRFRYIDRLHTNAGDILQVSSEIEGTLPDDYLINIGNILFDMLPAGSVSGAPKQATLNIIREAEQEPRGFYSGVAGYFDGQSLDSCVLIRFIEQKDNQLYFRSGGGITVNSRCEDEYNEAIQKVYLPF